MNDSPSCAAPASHPFTDRPIRKRGALLDELEHVLGIGAFPVNWPIGTGFEFQTDFALRGKHQEVECDKCHVAGKKYREAAQGCNDCHKKDDVHKGSLGVHCEQCHTENNWKEAKFDHSTTPAPRISVR